MARRTLYDRMKSLGLAAAQGVSGTPHGACGIPRAGRPGGPGLGTNRVPNAGSLSAARGSAIADAVGPGHSGPGTDPGPPGMPGESREEGLRMHKRVVSGLLALALVLGCAGIAVAADEAKPLYVQTIEKYPAPKLADVDGREYKVLFDPAKTKGTPEDAFKDLWSKVKAAAAKQGFAVTEKDKNPLGDRARPPRSTSTPPTRRCGARAT